MAQFDKFKRWTEKIRPKHVQEARVKDDKEALSALGRAGAMATLESKANRAAEAEYFNEKAAEQAAQEANARLEETNEHILPIDPEDEKEAA